MIHSRSLFTPPHVSSPSNDHRAPGVLSTRHANGDKHHSPQHRVYSTFCSKTQLQTPTSQPSNSSRNSVHYPHDRPNAMPTATDGSWCVPLGETMQAQVDESLSSLTSTMPDTRRESDENHPSLRSSQRQLPMDGVNDGKERRVIGAPRDGGHRAAQARQVHQSHAQASTHCTD